MDYERKYRRLTAEAIDSFCEGDPQDDSWPFGRSYTAVAKRELREAFCQEYLLFYWFRAYPMLFDRDDLWLAARPQREQGIHFGEWLGAIIFHERCGFKALVVKYWDDVKPAHRLKGATFRKEIGETAFQKYSASPGGQPPDLFLFDGTRRMFCEVKRKSERMTKSQLDTFPTIQRILGLEIVLLRIQIDAKDGFGVPGWT